ncbi:MAG TPA: rhodanese-like domain-containing protein [Cyclobacteriaceae bacterium]
MKQFILTVFFFMSLNSAKAQGGVEGKLFQLMLNTMLSHSVDEISVKQLDSLEDDFVLLDAREIEEYKVSKIKNARWVGYDHFDMRNVADLAKNDSIAVYCSVGYRSEKIAEKLEDNGYTNVYNVFGGIFEWVNQNKPVVDSMGKPTNKVHTYSKTWGIWLKNGEKVN